MTKRKTPAKSTAKTSQEVTEEVVESVKASGGTKVVKQAKSSQTSPKKHTVKGLLDEVERVQDKLVVEQCNTNILRDRVTQLERELELKKHSVEYWKNAYLTSENKTWWKITKERWNDFWYDIGRR